MRLLSRKTLGIIGAFAAVAIGGPVVGIMSCRHLHQYDSLIAEAGRRHGVDAQLIRSVIWQESRFKAGSIGRRGEIGLMQVTAAAAGEWAEASSIPDFITDDLFDPAVNIEAGTWYLGRAARRWSHHPDPLPFALAEYNAGPSNAQRWAKESGPDAEKFMNAIDYPTTKQYIIDILKRYNRRAQRP